MNDKEKAFLIVEKAHNNQSYAIYPYTYHIKEVIKIAEDLGCEESIIVAATLHDVIEDTDISYNDIKKEFGEEVAEIVYCVTDELGRNRKERKEKTYPKIRSNWKAVIVKICDRIANVEYSKSSNNGKFEMYKKEQKQFMKELHIHSSPDVIGFAWSRLNNLFYGM